MFSQVINGEYKNWGVKVNLKGQVVAQRFSQKIIFDDTTIKTYEVVDKSEGKSSLVKTAGLGALFGLTGAIAGANSKKDGKRLVKITWKNGKKSLVEFDSTTYKAFLGTCLL